MRNTKRNVGAKRTNFNQKKRKERRKARSKEGKKKQEERVDRDNPSRRQVSFFFTYFYIFKL